MGNVGKGSDEQRAWEDEVLRLVALSLLAGDSRHAMPGAAPHDWNQVSHIGFRRIFLSDDERPSTDSSLVIMFSFEDVASVVLAIAFPLGPMRGEPIVVAQRIVKRFVDRVFHQAHAHIEIDPDGPRLQWIEAR